METPVRASSSSGSFVSSPSAETIVGVPKKPLGVKAVSSNPLGGHAYKVTMGLYSIVSHADVDAKHAVGGHPSDGPLAVDTDVDGGGGGRLSSKLAQLHRRMTGDLPIWELVLYEVVRQVRRDACESGLQTPARGGVCVMFMFMFSVGGTATVWCDTRLGQYLDSGRRLTFVCVGVSFGAWWFGLPRRCSCRVRSVACCWSVSGTDIWSFGGVSIS